MNKTLIKLIVIVISCLGSTIQPMERLKRIMGHIVPIKQSQQHLINNQLSNKNITLGNRPLEVQKAVDKAFEQNKSRSGNWWYNGDFGPYGLMGISDYQLLKSLATNIGKKDIYILEVGCAKAAWGRSATKILSAEICKKSGKHFHIFSLTGSNECENIVDKKNNVTHYQFNNFKIENIDEEFTKLGFNLKGKVDLIISNWTLRHLADPFGTLKRMYSLLTPDQGMLMSNGFLFAFNDSDEVQAFPKGNENIFANSNAISLFRYKDDGRDADQFLLIRNDSNELIIPIEYSGNIKGIGYGYQCESGVITLFKKGCISDKSCENSNRECNSRYYWNKNQKSKDLYSKLRKEGYIKGVDEKIEDDWMIMARAAKS